MKIALCTTTIHVPYALEMMRRCDHDVMFFVAGDRKTPREAWEFCSRDVPGCVLIPAETEWKCSGVIGWNTLARRNIAFLEALKWGADVIYSWDNDNLPINTLHFDYIRNHERPFTGIKVTGTGGWFDPGTLLIPPTRHRGFPHDKPPSKIASPVVGAKVGVAAGLVIGDPDVGATTRLEHRPDVGGVHILGSTGVVVDPGTWTVFNSQNTAVIRELIPAWFMMPGVGRHDDIYASLIVQRVARERGYHAHFGPPFTYQQRNEHSLVADLRAEIDGMENVQEMAKVLDRLVLPGPLLEDVHIIYSALGRAGLIPEQAVAAATAWLNDCEGLGL